MSVLTFSKQLLPSVGVVVHSDTIEVKPKQLLNADDPIDVTELGIVIDASLEQL
jgi:hypothetical protein